MRSVVIDQQSLQEIVAALEARMQVLEGKQVLQVGELVAETDPSAAVASKVGRGPKK